jgi:hypothetical protein
MLDFRNLGNQRVHARNEEDLLALKKVFPLLCRLVYIQSHQFTQTERGYRLLEEYISNIIVF